VTTQAQRGGDAQVVYLVAEPDRTKDENIIRTSCPHRGQR
jgi:hypothetical protein